MSDQRSSPPPPNRSRLEDEVLEILVKSDRPPSNVIKFKSAVRRGRIGSLKRMGSVTRQLRVTPLRLLIMTVVLAVSAAIVEDSSPLLGRALAMLGIACFVALFVVAFRRPAQQGGVKTWRGRDVDFSRPRQQGVVWNWIRRILRRG